MKSKVIEEEEASYSEEDGDCYSEQVKIRGITEVKVENEWTSSYTIEMTEEQVAKKGKKSMSMKSKSMKKSQVTVVEAEYIAASQCVKTMLEKKEELESAGMQSLHCRSN